MKKKEVFNSKLTFVLVGRSGSGKGTQALFLLRKFGLKNSSHLETGRFLRRLIKKTSPTIFLAREFMHAGRKLPSWMAAYTWLRKLVEGGAAVKHLVFDGAPRSIWEAELIDEVVAWHGRPLPICIYIDVSVKEATKRLLGRNRSDDHLFSIRNRLRFFEKDVLPVVEYYKKRNRLIHLDGSLAADRVSVELLEALAKKLGGLWKNLLKPTKR